MASDLASNQHTGLDVQPCGDAHLCNFGLFGSPVLARAHARSGDRVAIAGYLGSDDVADVAFTRFAEAYADQTDRDYRALRHAVDTHRVAAASDK